MLLSLFSLASAAPGWVAILPFGVGVYMHGHPVRGIAYSTTQAAGLTTVFVAAAGINDAIEANDATTIDQLRIVTGAAVGVTTVSYFLSMLDSARLYELQQSEAAVLRVRAWEQASRYPQVVDSVWTTSAFSMDKL